MSRNYVLELCFVYHIEGHCRYGPKCEYLHERVSTGQEEARQDILNRVHAGAVSMNGTEEAAPRPLHHQEYSFYRRIGVCPLLHTTQNTAVAAVGVNVAEVKS